MADDANRTASSPTSQVEQVERGQPADQSHSGVELPSNPPSASGKGSAEDAQTLPPDKARELLEKAEALKQEGNKLYAEDKLLGAQAKYLEALKVAPPDAQERAVYLANMAACDLKLKQYKEAVQHCTWALEVKPSYTKALMRRSAAHEGLDDLEHALVDAKKVLELDKDNTWASKTVASLEPRVQERTEKLKAEMMGKLKDLGNSILGKFGMSLDNFKAEKDPATGSYSIKFQQ